jgi:hypothetical protein
MNQKDLNKQYINDINARFIHACQYLIDNGYVKNKMKLAEELGISSSILTEIFGRRMNAHVGILAPLFRKFNVTYAYIFEGLAPIIDNKPSGPVPLVDTRSDIRNSEIVSGTVTKVKVSIEIS